MELRRSYGYKGSQEQVSAHSQTYASVIITGNYKKGKHSFPVLLWIRLGLSAILPSRS